MSRCVGLDGLWYCQKWLAMFKKQRLLSYMSFPNYMRTKAKAAQGTQCMLIVAANYPAHTT